MNDERQHDLKKGAVMKARSTLLATLAVALLLSLGVRAHASACADANLCSETTTFVATLSNFRTSSTHGGANRVVSATLTIQNKTDRPLVLGYVSDSGVALDEHGNRYTVTSSSDIRGIGEIKRNTFDPKFTLQPGERSDARIDLRWHAGRAIAGVTFELELALREIDEVTGNQHRLGREHALRFSGLTDGASSNVAASSAPSHPTSSSSAASVGAPPTLADPCEGKPRCYSAGPFIAEIAQVVAAQPKANNHHVRVSIRFRNVSNQPIVLAYQRNSGKMLDNYGQHYIVDSRDNANVSGIGQTTGQKADPQFVLSPGEARSATFNYSRYVGKTAVGTVFSPELVIEQLEILPSQQIRSMREYAVSFANLVNGSGSANAEAIDNLSEAGRKLTEGLRSIFQRK